MLLKFIKEIRGIEMIKIFRLLLKAIWLMMKFKDKRRKMINKFIV
jgi:hypothetical protein